MAGIVAGGGQNRIADHFTKRERNAAIAPVKDFKPTGMSSGGFNFSFGDGTVSGGATAERLGYVRGLSSNFSNQAGQIGALRPMVAPGFSQLRESLGRNRDARLASIEDARSRATGDLRENLSRRRVLGSSFAGDALSRTDAEFQRERDRVIAETGVQEAATYLQELESTKALISEEFTLARNSIEVFLNNMNMEASLAAQFATGATNVLADNARIQSQLLQQNVNANRQAIENERGREHQVGMEFMSLIGGGMG